MEKKGSDGVSKIIALLGGVLGSTTCGALLYAWSVFIRPLNAEFGWNRADIILAFAIACLFFGLTTFPAGKLTDKFGARSVVMVGAVMLGAGFISSGFINYKWQLYVSYGIVAGFGGGLIYLPPIAVLPKWWPKRPALATGFSVVGMGFGSFIMSLVASYIIDNFSWRSVFIYGGIVMSTMAFIASFCLQNPKNDAISAEDHKPTNEEVTQKTCDYTTAEVIRTHQFWLMWIAYFCAAFAALVIIAHIEGYATDVQFTAMSDVVVGSCFAVTNTISRLLIVQVAERIGVKLSFFFIFSFQAIAILAFIPSGSIFWLMCILAALVGWNYGSMFTLFPVLSLTYYGNSEHGSTYGLLFTAWGIAGFSGPYVGNYLKELSGSYLAPFLVAAAMALVAMLIFTVIKDPLKFQEEAV